MDTLEEDILSDQMETSDNDMQSDQMDSLEEDPPARGDEDMEGGGRPPKRRKVETGMTNLQIESCLKDYPATMCYADELPAYVGVGSRTFIVNTDTCDRGGSHWVAFHFSAGKRTGNVSPPYRELPDRQRTAILLLFVSNPPIPTDCTISNGDIEE
jgi:hypothetical protein